MDKQLSSKCCGRPPGQKELSLKHAGYDELERCLLEIARYYWQSFATPETHSWLAAMARSEQYFGGSAAFRILSAVQAMRCSRTSCFQFNNPDCKGCAEIVTEHERQFMSTFTAVRNQKKGPAETHAMILCQGNETGTFIRQLHKLVDEICAENQPEFIETFSVHSD